jgi:hypothetical protein
LIHESDIVSLQKADELAENMLNYPVLDDNHYSNLEFESYNEAVDNWAFKDACEMLGLDYDAKLKEVNAERIRRACIDCFYYYGEECLNEKQLWNSLKESKELTPFSWENWEKSKGQGFFQL